jgi:hypothetical protein
MAVLTTEGSGDAAGLRASWAGCGLWITVPACSHSRYSVCASQQESSRCWRRWIDERGCKARSLIGPPREVAVGSLGDRQKTAAGRPADQSRSARSRRRSRVAAAAVRAARTRYGSTPRAIAPSDSACGRNQQRFTPMRRGLAVDAAP